MKKGVYYDNEFCGFNQWLDKNIDEMDDAHRENTYYMILNACKKFDVNTEIGKNVFLVQDGWSMDKDWLEKYACGFLKEIEKYWE